jgi:sodium pump decarboxylase gamma subunit
MQLYLSEGVMIFEGVKLMFVGMTTVMLFLILMIFFINLIAFLTRGAASREMEAIKKDREAQLLSRKKAQSTVTDGDGDEDIAVITAAVAAYEAELFAPA